MQSKNKTGFGLIIVVMTLPWLFRALHLQSGKSFPLKEPSIARHRLF